MTQPTDKEILDAAEDEGCFPRRNLVYRDGNWSTIWSLDNGKHSYRGTLREVLTAWIRAREER